MKKPLPLYLFLCLAALSGLVGCHKSNAHIDGLYGQWRWVKTAWIQGPSQGTAYPPPGSTTVLQLSNDGSFSITQNGNKLAANTYTVAQSCPNGNCNTVATFQNQYAKDATQGYYWELGNYLVSLQNGNLVLTFDGPWNPAGGSSTQFFVPN
jgi:hypothetical protein